MHPLRFWLLAGVILFNLGCGTEEQPGGQPVVDAVALGEALQAWQLAKSEAVVSSTTHLVNNTRAFLEAPDDKAREQWQTSWIDAHETYLSASLLLAEPWTRTIDSWPIAPGFIDSIEGYPTSGIVFDETLQITSAAIRDQHQITDKTEVAQGFHVLEYYAFARPLEDMRPVTTGKDIITERRRKLITLTGDLLLMDIMQYRRHLVTRDDDTQVYEYADLLRVLHDRCNAMFSDYNLIGEHSPFAKRDTRSISVQLTAIHELLSGTVDLNRHLYQQDAARAATLNDTLEEAIALVQSDDDSEATLTRLLLLCAALSHQFEEFQQASTR